MADSSLIKLGNLTVAALGLKEGVTNLANGIGIHDGSGTQGVASSVMTIMK